MTGSRYHRRPAAAGATLLFLAMVPLAVFAAEADVSGPARYFYSGDGHISLVSRKNGAAFEGSFRHADGRYNPAAIKAIHQVFDAPYTPNRPQLSLRLIEYLDYLEDQLNPGARITITSGFRNPAYNRGLRQGGGLAAKASLHQYGMAADLVMTGVPSRKLWHKVRQVGFGGTGYYHGETVHVDVGPARFWDAKTSGVGTGISDDNKLIGLVTDFDIYPPESEITMRFIRMTAFPIGVSARFELKRRTTDGGLALATAFRPLFRQKVPDECRQLADIDQMAFIRWRLPADLPPGRYTITARFCGRPWNGMPASATTPDFEITQP